MRLGPRRWGLGLGAAAGFWFSVFCFLFSGPWGRRPGWDRATGLGYGSGLVRFGQVWSGLGWAAGCAPHFEVPGVDPGEEVAVGLQLSLGLQTKTGER